MAKSAFVESQPDYQSFSDKLVAKINIAAVYKRVFSNLDFETVGGKSATASEVQNLIKTAELRWRSYVSGTQIDEKTVDETGTAGVVILCPRVYSKLCGIIVEELLTQASQHSSLRKDKSSFAGSVAFLSQTIMADTVDLLRQFFADSKQSNASAKKEQDSAAIIDSAVDSSMSMNHLFVDSLRTIQIAENVDQRVNSISAAIEEMSTTVSTITENTQQALHHIEKTTLTTAQGRNTSDQAMDTMDTIYTVVEDTTTKANELNESSKAIEGIVTQIQEIAEQTNLLALNATIEAARSGEAGRGFAVVANEVKSLASQTSRATQEIASIISNFVHSIQGIEAAMRNVSANVETGQKVTKEVKGYMHEIESHAQEVSNRMNDISTALTEQSQASNEVSQSSVHILESSKKNKEMSELNAGISRNACDNVTGLIHHLAESTTMTPRLIIKLGKSDHIVWKRKLADMLLSGAKLNQSEISDHTQCRLGKWYYGEGIKTLGHTEIFKKLEPPHIRVHELGRQVYDYYNQNRIDDAVKALEQMEIVSEEVIQLLNELDAYCAKHDCGSRA